MWEPDEIAVVIGYSQKAVNEVNLVNCANDKVPVLKRRGGGGAVVLMPGILCITMAFLSDKSISPYYFFKEINLFIIRQLKSHFNILSLECKGISDIAIDNKKILGCSIFKSRNMFFYQGSLLVNPDMSKIDQYLLHPTKEPDYRNGRKHQDFLTCLQCCGYEIGLEEIQGILDESITRELRKAIT